VQLAQRVLTVLSQVQQVQQVLQVQQVQQVLQVQLETLVEQHLTTPLILLQLTATLALEKLDLTTQTFKLLASCLLTMSQTVRLTFNSSLELLTTQPVRSRDTFELATSLTLMTLQFLLLQEPSQKHLDILKYLSPT
jgi:hypothetical protein